MAGWVALTLLALYAAGAAAIKAAESEFNGHVAEVANEFKQKIHANEAVLSAFTAFLSAVDGGDRNAAVRFTRSMLGAYPHVYMLEVARALKSDEVAPFERTIRRNWQSDFRVRSFTYTGNRQWVDVAKKSEYWPIVFLQPDFPEARSIYGLDLDSVAHLAAPLSAARHSAKAVASAPFRLVEGDFAYVLFQAVGRPISGGAIEGFGGEMMAMLLVRSESMSPRWIADGASVEATMHPAVGESAPLFRRVAAPTHWSEAAALPRLTAAVDSGSAAQPIRLAFERQLRWRDINGLGLRAVAALSLLSLALVMLYLRHHHLAMQHAEEEHERAEFLAMHDPLTGLPNRTLLADRVRQALSRQQRHGAMFALFMIDLDRFKEINDEHGHEGGDAVLLGVAGRIAPSLRATDTVARFGGDEFIVLVADVQGEADAVNVAEKLLQSVSQPIEYRGAKIAVTCSVGVALCPRDGHSLEELLRQADHAMYRVKSGGRNGLSVAAEAI
jgi:diguanylate cyclase (GGDEF)-like protein